MSTITIPTPIVRYAHESLCRRLGEAASDIATLSEARGNEHGEQYAEPIERFDRNRDLLEVIGWTSNEAKGAVTITGRRHRATLRQALRVQLELERGMTEEDPKLVGSEQQIERARRSAREIEQFLTELRTATKGKA
jgi:hypothetical protein